MRGNPSWRIPRTLRIESRYSAKRRARPNSCLDQRIIHLEQTRRPLIYFKSSWGGNRTLLRKGNVLFADLNHNCNQFKNYHYSSIFSLKFTGREWIKDLWAAFTMTSLNCPKDKIAKQVPLLRGMIYIFIWILNTIELSLGVFFKLAWFYKSCRFSFRIVLELLSFYYRSSLILLQ